MLGRIPSPPDPRDYQLAHFLVDDPLDVALDALLKRPWTAKTIKDWASLATRRIKATSPAPPVPAPASQDIVWTDSDAVLDQGNTPHCVGFGFADWGNTLPIDDHFADGDGHDIYYECKQIDGDPNNENGSSVRSGAKAMKARKRLSAYAFAQSVDEVRAWIGQHGPVVFGTDWDQQMFTPDTNGYLHPDGNVAGGHCYVCVGDLASEGALLFQNSWGADWGNVGKFKLSYADADSLLARNGEACAAVELA